MRADPTPQRALQTLEPRRQSAALLECLDETNTASPGLLGRFGPRRPEWHSCYCTKLHASHAPHLISSSAWGSRSRAIISADAGTSRSIALFRTSLTIASVGRPDSMLSDGGEDRATGAFRDAACRACSRLTNPADGTQTLLLAAMMGLARASGGALPKTAKGGRSSAAESAAASVAGTSEVSITPRSHEGCCSHTRGCSQWCRLAFRAGVLCWYGAFGATKVGAM